MLCGQYSGEGQGIGGKRHFCEPLAEPDNIATTAANLRDAHDTALYNNDALGQYGLTLQDAGTAPVQLRRAARAPESLEAAPEELN
jgi:hypothetical protein